ncbi:unnamed protein product [Paramecium pentaurelia]|uniref:EGF-like domain-containing protein n=1 Tax=Paramecium pentaurelia TaxID=43138 RepID=A0A8S1WWK6_9CILI|nr:unnamed protein product [Paramecium pentaurelia]
MIFWLLLLNAQCELLVIHSSLYAKTPSCGSAGCNLDGWTQQASPNYYTCVNEGLAMNYLDSINKQMYRGLSYGYPKVQFVVWFDLFFMGTWNNEAIQVKYNNVLFATITYTNPTTYPYSTEFCDSKQYQVISKKVLIVGQSNGNLLITNMSANGKVVIRNLIFAVEKCHWSCRTCTNQNSCQTCFTGTTLNAFGLCTQCAEYLDPSLGCVPICDINKYPNSDKFCVDITEQSILNDQFKNPPPNVQWIRQYDPSGLTTISKCSQYFGLLTGNEGMEKKISQPTQYKHKLRIKVVLYLYNTIPLNQGIFFTINNNYIAQLYNSNSVITMHNGYILRKTSQSCAGVGSGQLYTLIIISPIPTGDFIMRIQGNMQITTTVWGVTQIQIVAGTCQQECLTCTSDFICSQCIAGYYIYQGLCTNSMQSDRLSLNTTHVITYDTEYPYSTYLVSDFINYNIRQDPETYFTLISQNFQNFLTGFQTFGLYTKKIFGGPYVWTNAKFNNIYSINNAHYAISIRMKIILGDLFAQQFIIEFDTNGQEVITAGPLSINLFGRSSTEYSIDKYWYISHSTNSLTITIECQGNGDLLHEYCGISDYYIVVHQCFPFCLVCTDSTEIGCTSWDANYYTAKFSQVDCLSNEYYYNYNCNPCNILCSSCRNYNLCDTCINNLVLINDLCTCSQGYYFDTGDQQCHQCDPLCQHCLQYNFCIVCLQINRRYSNNGVCECEESFYEQLGNDVCIKCDNSCLTCNGPLQTDCTNCNTIKNYDLKSDGQCLCKSHYYLSYGDCIECHLSCKECFGPNQNNCLECDSTKTLYQLQCKCNLGYFDSGISISCNDCPIIENPSFPECYFDCNGTIQWFNINCTYAPVCLSGQSIVNYKCQSICGDNIIMSDEQCEDLNNIMNDGCYNCQYQCPLSCPNCNSGSCTDICGDGYVTGTEQCDDGITTIGCNGCTYQCQSQCSDCQMGRCFECNVSGYMLDIINNKCIEHCGDGVIIGSEECEDSNSNPNDGCDNCKFKCRSDCLECTTNGKVCNTCLNSGYKTVTGSYKCSTICGDGLRISNTFETEQCDDGNLIGNDGCSSTCQWQCQPSPICTTCSNNLCSVCGSGYTLISTKNKCVPICGDGIVKTSEICDDGNNIYFDGCHQCQLMCQQECVTCTIMGCTLCEIGYTLNLFNNKCISLCGDGYVNGNEECDDLIHQNCNKCRYICDYGCISCIYGICYRCQLNYNLNQQTKQCEIIIINQSQQLYQQQQLNNFNTYQLIKYCKFQIQSDCLECESNFKWNPYNQQCQINNFNCQQNCLYCKQEQCIVCQNDFILINSICIEDKSFINTISICKQSCKYCLNDICLQCNKGYYPVLDTCQPICGDQIKTLDEQCDDNNNIYDDGCFDCQFYCFGNCLNCQFGQCLECEEPEKLIISKMQCYDPEKCDKGYYVSDYDNLCYSKCGDYIKTEDEECDSKILCDNCILICSSNCKYCVDRICYTCEDEYTLNEHNQCQFLQQSQQLIPNLFNFELNNTLCFDDYCYYQSQPIMKLQLINQTNNNIQFLNLFFDQEIKFNCKNIQDLIKIQLIDDDNTFINSTIITQSQNLIIQILYLQTVYNPIIQIKLNDRKCIMNQFNQTLQDAIIQLRTESIILLTESEQLATDILQNIANTIQYIIIITLPALLIVGQISNFLNFVDLLQFTQYQQYINITQTPNMQEFLQVFKNTSFNKILSSFSFYNPYYIPTQFQRNGSFITTSIPITQVYAFTILSHYALKSISKLMRQSTLDLRTQNKLLLKFHIFGNKFIHNLNKNNLSMKLQNLTVFCGLEICMNAFICSSMGISNIEQIVEFSISNISSISYFLYILNTVKMPTLITLRSKDNKLNPIYKSPEKYRINAHIYIQSLKKLLYPLCLVYCHKNPTVTSVGLFIIDFGYGLYVYEIKPFKNKLENGKIMVQQINSSLVNCCNIFQSINLLTNPKILGFIQMGLIAESLTHSFFNEVAQKKDIIIKLFKKLFHYSDGKVENPGIIEFLVYE